MIISHIELNNCVYYHLHAEQAVTAAFTGGTFFSIMDEELSKSTLEKIKYHFHAKYNEQNQFLVLNFDGIKNIQNNLSPVISGFKKYCKELIFINVKSSILNELGLLDLFQDLNRIYSDSDIYDRFFLSPNEIEPIINSTIEVFNNKFKELLKSEYIDEITDLEKQFHSSSSVYIPRWINIKRFISNDKEFFTYSIYNLAFKTYNKWKDEFEKRPSEKPVLVCQNLNSSYIASVLSTFLKTDLLILDQIGPINKMYSILDSKVENNRKYIVVSDVVCLGTEVKIAKSLIEFLGGIYLGNISIIRIQTISPEHKKYENAECVFVIDRNNNTEIEYQIKTDLS
jgi:hypothetical protein